MGYRGLMSGMGVVSVVATIGHAAVIVLERRWVRHEESASAAHGALNVPLVDVSPQPRAPPPPSSNPLQDVLSSACMTNAMM